jgi:hypothetical protein
VFLNLGFAGGFLYLYIMFTVFRESAQYVHKAPRSIGFPMFAVVASGILGWVIGQQYSTTALFMFFIGALANQSATMPVSPVKQKTARPMTLPPPIASTATAKA